MIWQFCLSRLSRKQIDPTRLEWIALILGIDWWRLVGKLSEGRHHGRRKFDRYDGVVAAKGREHREGAFIEGDFFEDNWQGAFCDSSAQERVRKCA